MARQAQAIAPETQGATVGQAPAKSEEALPLPKFLMRIYYIFPIILYVPDMIFNFYVYSNGQLNLTFPDVLLNPEFYLWAFLAAGIVGMAWLLSVLAPWHWVRGNHFQSIMCWFGVVIATAITTWCSLAWRSRTFTSFATDQWVANVFHIDVAHFSPTMILVAVAPPFWGLFWAIVQPAERRRNVSEQAEEFELKKLRMQQASELKKMRAEANAQVRGAQLAGLAASMKAARTQIGAAMTNNAVNADEHLTDTLGDGAAANIDPPSLDYGGGAPEGDVAPPSSAAATGLRDFRTQQIMHPSHDTSGSRAATDSVRDRIRQRTTAKA